MRLPRSFAFGVSMLLTGAHGTACAADFSSIAETAAVLYDAPSAKAKKLFVIGHGYPVEVIVVIDRWVKIRDASGEMAWIEAKDLNARRTVMVKARVADIRQAAEDHAPLAFRAEQGVLLDLVELTGTGWARVTHRDGQGGYVKLSQVWGV